MSRLAILTAAGLLSGCMSGPPITVPSNSAPSSRPANVAPSSSKTGSQPVAAGDSSRCAIHLAEIRDIRPDPGSLGMMGARVVKAEDSVAWVRTALAALSQDRRFIVSDDAKAARFDLRVELVKAYIMAMATQKTSNIVLRVSYSRDGQEGDTQVLRGRDTGGNWAFGEGETQESLNRALADAVQELDKDIVAHCAAGAAK